jgi:GLPGLI family protein
MLGMNKLLILLLYFVTTAVSGQRQPAALRIIYEYRNAGTGEVCSVELLIQGTESLTVFLPGKEDNSAEEKDFSIHGKDAMGRRVYKNLSTSEIFFRDYYPQGMEFEPCLVKDPLKPMEWTFGNEQKKVGSYLCKQAFTKFRGRSYQVWYAPDFPVVHGPWKFSGLPGAMVEIRSADSMIEFDLMKVESVGKTQIARPDQGKELSMSEYVSLREKSIEDFVSALKSKLPRGAEVTVNTTGDYNLETDFSDIKK